MYEAIGAGVLVFDSRGVGQPEIVEKGLGGTGPHREELDWKGPPAHSLAVYVSRFPGPGAPGAVVVVHDVTEVRSAERVRQDFVANVSHELKTPLAVIKSNVEALVDGAVDDPDARGAFLGQVTQEADRLEELIKDLLSLARIESGGLIGSSLARIMRRGRGAIISIDFAGACSRMASSELIVTSLRHDGAIVAWASCAKS